MVLQRRTILPSEILAVERYDLCCSLRVVDINIEPSVSRCFCRVFYFFKSRGKKEDPV